LKPYDSKINERLKFGAEGLKGSKQSLSIFGSQDFIHMIVELKQSYIELAVQNLDAANSSKKQLELF